MLDFTCYVLLFPVLYPYYIQKKKRFLLTLYSQLAFTCSSISIADFEQVFT